MAVRVFQLNRTGRWIDNTGRKSELMHCYSTRGAVPHRTATNRLRLR